MRLIVNALAALKPKTGVGHHTAELLAALARDFPELELVTYPDEWIAKRIRKSTTGPAPAAPPRFPGVKQFLKSAGKELGAWHFAMSAKLSGATLYHEPNFLPFRTDLPTTTTVHDLSVIKFPQWHPVDRVHAHRRKFTHALKHSAQIVTVSEAVRREVITELGIPPERVTAIPNGISPNFSPCSAEEIASLRKKHDLPERFFLCVGTIEPRKNLLTAMRAYVDLPQELRAEAPLVLAGPWGWRAEAERAFFDRHRHLIRQLGYVPADDLPALYSAATCLLYPSHYEGFGLPPLETAACGGAAIVSTADAVREVCGDWGIQLPANDISAWREAMRKMLTDEDFRDEARRGGRARAALYTWSRAAHDHVALWRSEK